MLGQSGGSGARHDLCRLSFTLQLRVRVRQPEQRQPRHVYIALRRAVGEPRVQLALERTSYISFSARPPAAATLGAASTRREAAEQPRHT
jgi:hypothetical protein